MGAAVAIFGAHSLKKEQDSAFLAESKNALNVAAKNLTNDIYDEICRRIEDGLAKVERNLFDCISYCCENIMDSLIKALNEKKQSGDDYAQQREKLNNVKHRLEVALQG